jgi:cobyrinic acid a,c-diamide synthase
MESTGIEVLGILPRDAGIEAPSRHLGLVPAAEREDAAASLARLAGNVAQHVSLTQVLAIAYAAPALTGVAWDPAAVVSPASPARPVVAVAGGRAFTFRYPETEELLRAGGCEPVAFDPLTDDRLPEGTAGIYLGGGFPEVHAVELSANAALRAELRAAVEAGVPTVAECAGLLYLCTSVDGHPMVGALPAEATMTPRLTLGYRTAIASDDSLLAAAGARVTGHEFHRTIVEPGAGEAAGWLLEGVPAGFSTDPAGLGRATLHASYLHTHWAGHPQLAQRFCDEAHAAASRSRTWAESAPRATGERVPAPQVSAPGAQTQPEHDLHHHGDRDVADGLVDLAVNVRVPTPPGWLREVIDAVTPTLAGYPRTDAAVAAIAAAHGVLEDHVLPTAGGAEAFTLLARALRPAYAVVVHPQFTEPEAALLAAGHRPHRLLLDAASGFALDPARVPAEADLVMVGNPTNPTSVLHPAQAVRRLVRPGRVVCVDEAFMDAVPGEEGSLLAPPYDGVVVLRSLTKTWGLAGLRAGYVVGDPSIVAAMRAQQPPWSVSTPALAATAACLTPRSLRLAGIAAEEIRDRRDHLVEALAGVGLPVTGTPAAPFVLVDTTSWARPDAPADWVRLALRELGFAVRRGETFPGLDASWVRIAVRDEETTRSLVKALRVVRESAGADRPGADGEVR